MKGKSIVLTLLIAVFFNAYAVAQSIKVATAANLQSVIKVLGADFHKRTHITIEPIISSSGKLVAQISNGAPYDVFLSADMGFPEKLSKDGFSDQPPVIYALGSLIVCNSQEYDLNNWQHKITTDLIPKIAIANPKTAPYGHAAEEALTRLNLINKVKTKLVYGESIAQVNTYISSGVVALGFTTQAFAVDMGRRKAFHWVAVDKKLYSPIQQGMVLLKNSPDKAAAHKFYNYMLSAPAKSILKKYGYLIP